MIRRHRWSILTLSFGTALLLVVVGGLSTRQPRPDERRLEASTVECGQLITTDTVVANDLDCDSSHPYALRLGKSGITLDMNGHDFQSSSPANPTDYGIMIESHDNVTITGPGRIRNFEHDGIWIQGHNNRVEGLNIHANGTGIQIYADPDSSRNNVITSNTIASNDGYGVRLECSCGTLGQNNKILNNKVLNNGGVGISSSFNGTQIKGNTVNGNGVGGIRAGGAAHGLPSPPTIGGNVADHNTGWGIDAGGGTSDAGGNRARGNTEAAQCRNVVCS